MWLSVFLRSMTRGSKPPWTGRIAGPGGRAFRPRLEPLEGRDVPSTLTVVNAFDKGAGSLRDAVAHARDGDMIVFDQSLSGQTIALTSGALVVKNSVDIEGPGPGRLAVSGSDTSRVFDIGAGLTVTVAGLTITRGRAAGNWGGGGILNVGSTLNLVNDVFSNNRAIGSNADATSMGGGAVTNRNGGVLSVTACGFAGNQAVGREGGLGEGGAIWNLATATITGSTFTGNRAVGGDGGRVTGGSTNIGTANGGAVFNQSGATLTVSDSMFLGNMAVGGCGGTGGDGASAYFVGVATGGGITNGDHANLVVTGCTFTGNRAVGGSNVTGGATGQGGIGNAAGGAGEPVRVGGHGHRQCVRAKRVARGQRQRRRGRSRHVLPRGRRGHRDYPPGHADATPRDGGPVTGRSDFRRGSGSANKADCGWQRYHLASRGFTFNAWGT